jgi:hypothetical protein
MTWKIKLLTNEVTREIVVEYRKHALEVQKRMRNLCPGILKR